MPHGSGERASLIVTILLVIVSMFLVVVANVPKGNYRTLCVSVFEYVCVYVLSVYV